MCGLIQSIARFDAVIDGASANPFDPDGSASGASSTDGAAGAGAFP